MMTLIPVKMPWRISPNHSGMQLSIGEYQTAYATEVTLQASICIVEPDSNRWEFHAIRIGFGTAVAAKLVPYFAEQYPLDCSLYEGHITAEQSPTVAKLDDFFREMDREWTETGMCPDSGLYKVEKSEWIEQLKLPPLEASHYLLIGREALIEIITGDKIIWNSIRSLYDIDPSEGTRNQ